MWKSGCKNLLGKENFLLIRKEFGRDQFSLIFHIIIIFMQGVKNAHKFTNTHKFDIEKCCVSASAAKYQKAFTHIKWIKLTFLCTLQWLSNVHSNYRQNEWKLSEVFPKDFSSLVQIYENDIKINEKKISALNRHHDIQLLCSVIASRISFYSNKILDMWAVNKCN